MPHFLHLCIAQLLYCFIGLELKLSNLLQNLKIELCSRRLLQILFCNGDAKSTKARGKVHLALIFQHSALFAIFCEKHRIYVLGKFVGPDSRPVLFIKNIGSDYFWAGRLTTNIWLTSRPQIMNVITV